MSVEDIIYGIYAGLSVFVMCFKVADGIIRGFIIMRFLGLVASQGGLFHLPENMFLKKVLQKRLNTKIFISDKPEFCGAIGAGLFAVDSDRLLERLECNALNINPKNLVILIGTNDIGIGVPTEYTLKNIKEILQRTQTLCSNTAVKSSIRA